MAALLFVCVAACGSSDDGAKQAASVGTPGRQSTVNAPTPAQDLTAVDADKDSDIEASEDDTNNSQALDFGHAASPSDRLAVTVLVKSYYAAALAANGTTACSLLYSTLAEAVPEDYGTSPPSQPYMVGKTCPIVLSKLFKHFHADIAAHYPKLVVRRVRLVGQHGFAVLRFSGLPERQIRVAREGHVWKIGELLDSELP